MRAILWLAIGSLYERLRGPIVPAPAYIFDGLPEFEFADDLRGESIASDAWRSTTLGDAGKRAA